MDHFITFEMQIYLAKLLRNLLNDLIMVLEILIINKLNISNRN